MKPDDQEPLVLSISVQHVSRIKACAAHGGWDGCGQN